MGNDLKVTGYVQAQAGYVLNDNAFLNAGVTAGGALNYKGTFIKGEAGAGTALAGKIELGHDFDLGKNMGLTFSAKAQHATSLIAKDNVTLVQNVEVATQNGTYQAQNLYVNEWSKADTKFGGDLMLTKQFKRAKIGLGIEAGAMKSGAPNIDYTGNVNVNVFNDQSNSQFEYQDVLSYQQKTKYAPYVTPRINAEIQLDKKGHFSAIADGTMYDGQAGIRYNF